MKPTNVIVIPLQKACLITLGVIIPVLTQGYSCKAQTSTAESTSQLQQQYDSLQGDIIGKISQVPDHPELLENGSIATQLQTAIDHDLVSLGNRIEQQSKILSVKAQEIPRKRGLSKTDRKELTEALRKQTGPLDNLKEKNEALIGTLTDLSRSGLSQWKDTYEQFKNNVGEAKGREKLLSLAKKFCEPYGVAVPPLKASSVPSPTPANSQSGTSADAPGGSSRAGFSSSGVSIKSSFAVPAADTSPDVASEKIHSPAPDAIPYLKQEMPVRVGVVRSITPGEGNVGFTVGNDTTQKQSVRFRVIVLNRAGVVLADESAGWMLKRLDPGSESLIKCSFVPKQPEELKFTSFNNGFDALPAWVLLRASDGEHGINGSAPDPVNINNDRHHRHDQLRPIANDMIPIEQEINIGKGILDRITFLQGKMNVSLRNNSKEKKPVSIRIYLLNSNGIIIDRHDIHWMFKQMDPEARTIESLSLNPSLPKSLKYIQALQPLDSKPRYLLIRTTDDSPFNG